MKHSASMKTFLYLFFVPLSSAAIHSLQYFTAVTAKGNFTFGLVDGERFLYYSHSNNRTMIAEWIKKFDSSRYWDRETCRFSGEQKDLHHHFSQLGKVFNHTTGNHTMQWMYGCELHDNGTTEGYNLYSYDGTHDFHLDMNTLTWTTNESVENFTNIFDPAGNEAVHMNRYLKNKCIYTLSDYVSFLKSSQWKVRPKVSVFKKQLTSPEMVCHATGFFPKTVTITWQKDREVVQEKDMDLRETLPNPDGSFQKRSILKVPAEELQKHTYTCVIQHSSLEKELVLPVSERRILRGGESDRGSDGGSDGGSGGGSDGRSGGDSDGVLIGVIVTVVVALCVLSFVAGIVTWQKKKNPDFRLVPVVPV